MKEKYIGIHNQIAIFLGGLFLLFLSINVQAQVFNVLDSRVEQGGVFIFRISPQYQLSHACISLMGNNYYPNMFGDVFVGVDVNTKPGKYTATLVECGRGFNLHPLFYEEVEVFKKNFPISRIRKKLISINTPKRIKEAQEIQGAYSKSNSWKENTQGKFIHPLDNIIITDEFGRRRVYLNGESRHGGVDLRAPLNTPIKAINSGIVLMTARDFSLEGNMVILDHGSGILSLYLHMARINVNEGSWVNKGENLGLSGDTGAVSGPHLHLMIKINKINVDPLRFIETVNNFVP